MPYCNVDREGEYTLYTYISLIYAFLGVNIIPSASSTKSLSAVLTCRLTVSADCLSRPRSLQSDLASARDVLTCEMQQPQQQFLGAMAHDTGNQLTGIV